MQINALYSRGLLLKGIVLLPGLRVGSRWDRAPVTQVYARERRPGLWFPLLYQEHRFPDQFSSALVVSPIPRHPSLPSLEEKRMIGGPLNQNVPKQEKGKKNTKEEFRCQKAKPAPLLEIICRPSRMALPPPRPGLWVT